MIGQSPELVLQSFFVLPNNSHGPAKTEGAITRDAIDKAEDKSRFFMMR